MLDVAVIGGGVSGLATAFDLKRSGHRVVVLERQARPGGNAQSERLGGFLMEHGPSTVNAAYVAATAFSRELGLEGARCALGPGVRRRYLVGNGSLHGIPIHPLGFLVADYLSLPARVRLLTECLVPRRTAAEDETVAAFAARRFGPEFAERVIDPLVAGLYAGRAEELSIAAVFPKLVALERRYGSISLGMLRRHRQGATMPGNRLFSWQHGIGTLPATLARRLGGAVKTGVAVRRLRHTAHGFQVDAGALGTVEARAVVVATQPHVVAALVDGLDDAAAAAAAAIAAPPLAVVYLGFRRNRVAHPLDGLGFLAAESEGRALSGAQFCSTMFPGRAPQGFVAVAGYFGGARAPHMARLSERDLIALAKSEFSDLIGSRGDPVVARVRHWPVGLPQYRMGHLELTACMRGATARLPGLFFTGNYFAGPSVAACLGLARETAIAVHGYLEQREKSTSTSGGMRTNEQCSFDDRYAGWRT